MKKSLRKKLDLKRYSIAAIKIPYFFITLGPKGFSSKLKEKENYLRYSNQSSLFFNFLSYLFSPKKILKGIKILFTKGPKAVIEKIQEKNYQNFYQLTINQEYQLWLKKHYPTKKDLENQKKESKKFHLQPLISIITPVYNPHPKHLKECIDSVLNQSYKNWQLCLVDDASTNQKILEIIRQYAKKDKRITYKLRKKNGHICQASNDALNLAKGEYIALLDHDDFLWPNALYEVVKLLNKKPYAQFIYSDEDKIDYDGKTHLDPFFKPDWSPDYLRSINYITHFAVLKKSLIEKIGGFRRGTEGAQDWDLFLRATYHLEKTFGHCHPLDKKNPIQHISTILYSWRKTPQSTSSEKNAGKVKNYAYVNQVKVINDYIKLRNLSKYLYAEKSKYFGQVIIKIKNKEKLINLLNKVYVNENKNNNIQYSLDHILPIFLFNKNSIVLPSIVKNNNVYDIEGNWLFFKNSPQPHPFLLKKDSNFNYVKLKKETLKKIIEKKIPFITLNNSKFNNLNINNLLITHSPYFFCYVKKN